MVLFYTIANECTCRHFAVACFVVLFFIVTRIVDDFSWRACCAGSLVGASLIGVRVLIAAVGVRRRERRGKEEEEKEEIREGEKRREINILTKGQRDIQNISWGEKKLTLDNQRVSCVYATNRTELHQD